MSRLLLTAAKDLPTSVSWKMMLFVQHIASRILQPGLLLSPSSPCGRHLLPHTSPCSSWSAPRWSVHSNSMPLGITDSAAPESIGIFHFKRKKPTSWPFCSVTAFASRSSMTPISNVVAVGLVFIRQNLVAVVDFEPKRVCSASSSQGRRCRAPPQDIPTRSPKSSSTEAARGAWSSNCWDRDLSFHSGHKWVGPYAVTLAALAKALAVFAGVHLSSPLGPLPPHL